MPDAKPTAAPNDVSGIDTTPIEELLKIKEQHDELEGLVARAETTKEKVSEAVYKRVKKDYEGRLAALEAEAKPRRKKGREELGKLQPIHDRLKKAVDDARLDKEELEFRHEVGEIEDPVFEEKHKTAEEVLEKCLKEFKEADDLKERFVSVIGPPEPEPPPPPPPPPPAPVSSLAPPSDEEMMREMTEPSRLAPSLADMRAAAAAEGVPPPHPEPEVVDIEESTFIPQHLDLPTPAPVSGRSSHPAPEAPEGSTMVMRFARLVSESDEAPEEFQLGLRTSIGRTQDNEICIPNPSVSRKHAVITFSDGAYVIADLKSGNGTYVNEERIDQHALQHGDRIRVGPAVLVFEAS